MRHRNRGTNDWGWQGVGPTLFLWRMIFWCATEMTYFWGAPSLVRHRYYFYGALVDGAPQNCIPSIRALLLALSSLKHLDLSHMNLTTVLDWVPKINMLPALIKLYVQYTSLRNRVAFLGQSNLTALELYHGTTLAPPLLQNGFGSQPASLL
jgi:hypothetical protein